MRSLPLFTAAAVFAAMHLFAPGALAAGDPVAGAVLYKNAAGAGCTGCHGTDPTANQNKILNGANQPAVIQKAIDNGTGGMGLFKPLTATDVANLAAYIGDPAAGTPAPKFTASTAALAFGNQQVATSSAAMTVSVSNSGSAPLAFSAITLAGAQPGDFALSGSCSPATPVPAGASCTISATFKPQAVGPRSATISVTHNAAATPAAIALTGNGTPTPVPGVSLSANALAFGDQAVNTNGAPKTVTLTNSGGADLALSNVGVSGANAGEFARSGSCAAGLTIPPGGSCSLTVTFTPTATGPRSASLDLASNAAGSPHQVALTGAGVGATAPALVLSSTLIAFGNQVLGTPSAPKPVTLTNPGSAPLALAGIATSGSGFAHSSTCGGSIAAGGSCVVSVTFTPASIGAVTGTLTITSNAAGSPHTVSLTGTGADSTPAPATVTVTPERVVFAGQPVHTTSAPRPITVKNSGAVPLAIAAIVLGGTVAADFRLGGTCAAPGNLAPGGSCTIAVTFTPAASGERKAQVALMSNAAGSHVVELVGSGTEAAATGLVLSTRELEFRKQLVGSTSRARRVTLFNRGAGAIAIAGISISGDFAYSTTCGRTLAARTSCTIDVTFRPARIGTATGALSIASSAAGSPHRVALHGEGTAQARESEASSDARDDRPRALIVPVRRTD